MHIIITVLFLIYPVLCVKDLPCNKLDTNFGSVCVCNSAYCDTINQPKRLLKGQYHFYYTSNKTPGFNHVKGHFRKQTIFSTYGVSYLVDRSKTFQTLRGFGGSFTDSFGYTLSTLPHAAQEKVIRSYFSKEGLEYNLCRVVLGSSDFSLRDYSYLPSYDPTLKSFRLTYDDYQYKIRPIQWALSVTNRKINFLGSTWTAPSWMKTNNGTTAGYLLKEYRQLWADYYVKTLDAFKKEGIEFWGLTTGNEPVTLLIVKKVATVSSFPEEQREWFVNNLAPTLKRAKYNDLMLIFLDDMRMFAKWWMEEIMREPRIKEYKTGIGLHWYTDFATDPTILDELHTKYPHQEILYTEASINVVINKIEKKYQSKKLGIIIQENGTEFYKQPQFYVMGHFSKFLAPGSKVISVAILIGDSLSYHEGVTYHPFQPRPTNSNVQFIAVVNPDESTAIIFHNPKDYDVQITVRDPDRGDAILNLEAKSLNTLIYW